MTCIVFDGEELVSDSLMTMGDLKVPTPAKKIYTPEGDDYWEINGIKVIAFGFAGAFPAIPYVKELLQEGITYRTTLLPEFDLHFDCICVLETGDSYVLAGTPGRSGKQTIVCIPMNPPVCSGSGSPYAYAMVQTGKKQQARTAVKAAISLDTSCGGELQIFTVPPAPAVLSKRPPKPEVAVKEEGSKVGDITIEQLTALIKDVTKDNAVVLPPPVKEEAENNIPHVTH